MPGLIDHQFKRLNLTPISGKYGLRKVDPNRFVLPSLSHGTSNLCFPRTFLFHKPLQNAECIDFYRIYLSRVPKTNVLIHFSPPEFMIVKLHSVCAPRFILRSTVMSLSLSRYVPFCTLLLTFPILVVSGHKWHGEVLIGTRCLFVLGVMVWIII